ncbi:MAG TPA: hypothetical protein PKX15_01735, partial [Bacteroidales bacterium]|nr:hypothetical protein [Bacteroidales bacterium]
DQHSQTLHFSECVCWERMFICSGQRYLSFVVPRFSSWPKLKELYLKYYAHQRQQITYFR